MIESVRSKDRRVDATRVSGQRDTVPSYNNSYPDPGIPEVEVGRTITERRRMQGRFLKGPILMRDIGAAARLPGQTLAVLLAVLDWTAGGDAAESLDG